MKVVILLCVVVLGGCGVGVTVSNAPQQVGVCVPPKPGGGC